jgi:hypothetical protein
MDVKYIAIIKIYIFLFFKIAKALAVFISFIGKKVKEDNCSFIFNQG